jgi:hypothetical protein
VIAATGNDAALLVDKQAVKVAIEANVDVPAHS